MAKISARGTHEVDRYFDFKTKLLCILRSDGATLVRSPLATGGLWKIASRFKRDNPHGLTLERYLELAVARTTRLSGSRPALQCQCAELHDGKVWHNMRAWHKAGRPAPCPCPAPVRITLAPERTREITRLPSLQAIEAWSRDSVVEATDGCEVEPDGTCEHGCQSWLRVLGLI